MNICTRYKLICRIRHHMRRRSQYRQLQEIESEIYGVEASVYDELYFKQQWHFRYSTRLRKLLNKH